MKTYIKTSLLTVLLLAVFTISFSNANAENETLITNDMHVMALQANTYGQKSICLIKVNEWGEWVTKMVPCGDDDYDM